MQKIKKFFKTMYDTIIEARRLEAELMVKRYTNRDLGGR